MKPQDMRVTDAEKKDREVKLAARMDGKDGPDYPYGLTVHLDENVPRKLGMTELPKAGDALHLQGVARVSGVRQEERDGGDADRSIELQITHLGLAAASGDKEAAAGKIFDGAGKRPAANQRFAPFGRSPERNAGKAMASDG